MQSLHHQKKRVKENRKMQGNAESVHSRGTVSEFFCQSMPYNYNSSTRDDMDATVHGFFIEQLLSKISQNWRKASAIESFFKSMMEIFA